MMRILKIASVGEHRKLNKKGHFRLEGRWLVSAGLTPEKYVVVTNPKPGILILRMQE